VTTPSAVGADGPGDDAIAQLARRHGLDPLAPSAATTQYLDQAIERVARAYLTAEPAQLTQEVRLYVAWVRRLLDNSRAPARHHRLYAQLGYLAGILAQLSLARGDHDATQADCAAAMQAADAAGDGQLRAWILSIQAMLAAYTNRQQDVVDLTDAGLEAAGQAASATAVKLASLQARAHATLGDRRAAEAAMALARQTMARVSPEAQDRGLFAFPEEKLASHEARFGCSSAPRSAPRSPCSGPCACSMAPRGRAARPLTKPWSAFTWRDPMLSLASSTRHASRQNSTGPASPASGRPHQAPRP
jgi:hypothetical protein